MKNKEVSNIPKDDWLELLGDDHKIDEELKKKYDSNTKSEKVKKEIKKSLKKSSSGMTALYKMELEKKIYLWVLDGWTNKRITDELVANYNMTVNASQALIRTVGRSYMPQTKEDVEQLRGMYIEMYADLYKRSLEKKDLATARNILDSIIKLQGLAVQKIEAKVENTYNIEF